MVRKRVIKQLYKHPGTREARLILKQHGRNLSRCERCEDETGVCHIHHKDGNPYNNRIENLIVLCPNCHGNAHGLEPEEMAVEDLLEVGIIDEDAEIPLVKQIDKSVITVELSDDILENPSVEIPQKSHEQSQGYFPRPTRKPKHLYSKFLGYQCRHCKKYRPFKCWCDAHQEKRSETDKACGYLELR